MGIGVPLGSSADTKPFRTKGYVELRGPNWEKGVKLSTLFDTYDGDVIGSDTEPALQVQMDLERAQTTESDIEILVGFLSHSSKSRIDLSISERVLGP